ncbi:hypothetical protein H0H92_008118 [Tricholoma furcatifolium]|nr:hypothetical protein H0H92_008118 [Tricholoma furcatifolium]
MSSQATVLHEFDPKNMPFRRLGPSGLRVPVFSLGGWLTLGGSVVGDPVKEIIKTAFDAGINMFDTAEVYASGKSELEMGRVIKELGLRRTDLVITTKLFWGTRKGSPNNSGLSRKHIIEGTKESLERLGMDYVDVIFAHRPDDTVSMEEIVRAFNFVIDQGWAYYWATSEWSAREIEEAYHVADKLNLMGPIAEQCQHNMFHRERPEKEYEPLYRKYGLGTTTWSSLAAGLLTGKYNDGIPEGSRFATTAMFKQRADSLKEEEGQEKIRKVRELTKLAADELQTTPSALALAWVAKNPNTSTVILGASNAEQLKENLKAVDVLPRLTPEIMEKVEAILQNKPDPPVVLAASICTKAGKAVISRQFLDMTRTRIESLLASFPKLIPANTQHTSVETADVRYVYQPLEDLYILLITNKASNILQDIETLHLFARVVSDICRSADEREILKNSFELLGAFDEVVSMGYRENVNLMQVRSVLEMESHEEKIQEIIARNKEAEAKEELKRRAKQLEMQRREQQRRAAGGGGSSYLGGGVSGYSPVARFDAPEAPAPITRVASTTPAPRAPAFKGTGMKLGSKKTKQAELIDSLGGDVPIASVVSPTSPPAHAQSASSHPAPVHKNDGRGSLPEVEKESIHIAIKEQISLSLLRDGGVESMELKGDMNLLISDSALAHLRVALTPPTDFGGNNLQFKQHPNVAKFAPGQERIVALKDSSRAFPVGQSLAVLKWRYAGTDESNVPLSINCWPSPSNDGTCEVSIEYELENENVSLYDVVISIPLPAGSYPTVSSHTGDWSLDPGSHSLAWSVVRIAADDDTRSGSLIFTVGGDDVNVFFPVQVSFVSQGSLAGIGVASVSRVDGGEAPPFSVDALAQTEEYLVV